MTSTETQRIFTQIADLYDKSCGCDGLNTATSFSTMLREAARSASGADTACAHSSVETCAGYQKCNFCGARNHFDGKGWTAAPAPAETTATNRQALDQSDNHQCAKCGRYQLYTYDQGWICPECSGRYMGKFPRAPETPGQPVSEPPRETIITTDGRFRPAPTPPGAAQGKPKSFGHALDCAMFMGGPCSCDSQFLTGGLREENSLVINEAEGYVEQFGKRWPMNPMWPLLRDKIPHASWNTPEEATVDGEPTTVWKSTPLPDGTYIAGRRVGTEGDAT